MKIITRYLRLTTDDSKLMTDVASSSSTFLLSLPFLSRGKNSDNKGRTTQLLREGLGDFGPARMFFSRDVLCSIFSSFSSSVGNFLPYHDTAGFF